MYLQKFFISLLAWFILGITGGILKVLHYDTLAYIILPFTIIALLSAVYFISKRLRIL